MQSFKLGVSLILLPLLFSSCSGHMGGELRPDGQITACGGHHTDPQACGYATWNARVIGQIHLGQSMVEVREIMKHDAERRTIEGHVEGWYYITDYPTERMTVIEFTDGKVTGMKQTPWHVD